MTLTSMWILFFTGLRFQNNGTYSVQIRSSLTQIVCSKLHKLFELRLPRKILRQSKCWGLAKQQPSCLDQLELAGHCGVFYRNYFIFIFWIPLYKLDVNPSWLGMSPSSGKVRFLFCWCSPRMTRRDSDLEKQKLSTEAPVYNLFDSSRSGIVTFLSLSKRSVENCKFEPSYFQ